MDEPRGLLSGGCPGCPLAWGSQQARPPHLLRCGGCKVVSYCSKGHKEKHRLQHKVACNAIQQSREALELEEAALRAHPGDWTMPADVFNTDVGLFWGIDEEKMTGRQRPQRGHYGSGLFISEKLRRTYMMARFAAADSLLQINTTAAVEQALKHFTDMLQLNRSDNMGVRDVIPSLLLRLGQEQECYDFLKWWATMAGDRNRGWDDSNRPYLDITNANAFEPIDILRLGDLSLSLSQLVILALLKLRLYLDLSAVEAEYEMVCIIDHEPQPNRQVGKLAESKVPFLDDYDLPREVQALKDQYRELFRKVHNANRHFWSLLADDTFGTPNPPVSFTKGSIEEAHLALYQCRRAWEESDDAILMIASDTAANPSIYLGLAGAVLTTGNRSWGPEAARELGTRRGIGAAFPSIFATPAESHPTDVFKPIPRDHEQAGHWVCRHDCTKTLVYTDGACANNGQLNPQAGWAVVYGIPSQGCKRSSWIVSGRLENNGPSVDDNVATSNRAELRAAIAALRVRDWKVETFFNIVIATDSSYVVDGATSWAKNWVRNGWRTRAGGAVKNRDLWELFLGEVEECWERRLSVELWKIPRELNLDADAAAKAAAKEGIDFQGTGAAFSQVPTTTTKQRPRVLGLCIGNEPLFRSIHGDVLSEIKSKAGMELAGTPAAALTLLNHKPPPTVILVADGCLARDIKVLERVIDLLRGGATVVLGGLFSDMVNQGRFDRMFTMIGLPFKRSGCYQTTQVMRRDVVGSHLASQLPPTYAQKALYVKGVERSAVWYAPDGSPNEAAAVFATVGLGRLGYVGDVNGGDSSKKVVLAMCGLLS